MLNRAARTAELQDATPQGSGRRSDREGVLKGLRGRRRARNFPHPDIAGAVEQIDKSLSRPARPSHRTGRSQTSARFDNHIDPRARDLQVRRAGGQKSASTPVWLLRSSGRWARSLPSRCSASI